MSATYPLWFVLLTTASFGAVLGSFLNVVVYRLPRGLSIVRPPSACPRCEQRIAPYDNVPVLGWLWLGGKCRSCRAKISARYPIVEAVTAGLFLLMGLRFGLTWELIPACVFASAMIAVTLIDYDHRIIPDTITVSGVPLGLLSAFVRPLTLVDAVIGAALGFVLLFSLAVGYEKATGREGMGGGDIKLAAMLGAFLGWQGLLLTVFAASLLGSLVGGAVILFGKGGRRTALPFGTFLAPAAIAVYLWGGPVIAAYMARLTP